MDEITLGQTRPFECSYYSERRATYLIATNTTLIEDQIDVLNINGFRRSGTQFYRPECVLCSECKSVRVPVDEFKWPRRFKRTDKKFNHLTTRQIHQDDWETLYPLYEEYINHRHSDGEMYPPDKQQFIEFLCANVASQRVLGCFNDQVLVAVAICDDVADGLSAVYTFFSCDEQWSGIGTWMILNQIKLCQMLGKPYLYLGYYLSGHPKMAYKSAFKPLEMFDGHQWLAMDIINS